MIISPLSNLEMLPFLSYLVSLEGLYEGFKDNNKRGRTAWNNERNRQEKFDSKKGREELGLSLRQVKRLQ